MAILNRYFLLPIADRVMGTKINFYLKAINKMNTWSESKITDWQNQRFVELIKHSYEKSKYYNNLFKTLKLNPSDFNSKEDILKLPPLTKKIIRRHMNDILPSNLKNYKFKKGQTGGSTAEPLRFLQDLRSWSYCYANSMYYWSKLGYEIGDKYVALGSRSIIPDVKTSIKHKIYYSLKGKISKSAMNLSESKLEEYLDFIEKNNITFIYGYASGIYLLAKKAIELNFNKKIINGCITTSELLLPDYKKTIIEAFDCNIIDAYGAADGGITAFKYNNNKFEVGYNCIVDVGDSDSDSSNLYVTDLLNFSFPFLRYEVGDSGVVGKDKSYNGQVINKLLGRIPEIIKLENGSTLIAPGFTVLFGGLNVKSYRIIKEGENSIRIDIVKDFKYCQEDEQKILKSFKSHAGEDCIILLNYLENFDLTNSGKRNYFMTS
tara:strand:+ start:469 stop:1770 length:1302 start_codon:yes stop_codon:yes gene_type:complete